MTVSAQRRDYLSVQLSLTVVIRPDIIVSGMEGVLGIIDAKYKRTDGTLENHDFYQMVAYGTALACPLTYLFYPATEWNESPPLIVRNSSIVTQVRRLDLGSINCVELAEAAARTVFEELQPRQSGPVELLA